jgi:hypothetical protein
LRGTTSARYGSFVGKKSGDVGKQVGGGAMGWCSGQRTVVAGGDGNRCWWTTAASGGDRWLGNAAATELQVAERESSQPRKTTRRRGSRTTGFSTLTVSSPHPS